MHDLKIIAVGSSPVIAREIQAIARSILGETMHLDCAVTAEINSPAPKTFYLCAITQQEQLARIIPAEQLFVLDLHPTTKFFLDIAKIPAGSHVTVFNNLSPYTRLLAAECQNLGLNQLHFHSIAYAEMTVEETCAQLRKALYIIGVDCLMEHVLKKPPYEPALPQEAVIIGGKRTASIASASKLLAAIASFYKTALQAGRLDNAESIINTLKAAATRLINSNVGITATETQSVSVSMTKAEQLSMLDYLLEKFIRLQEAKHA